jgi:hypothetical protein
VKAHQRVRALAIVTLCTLSACETPTATRPPAAYDPTTLTNGLLYRWTSGTTIHVWVVPQALLSPFDLGVAVRQGMVEWNTVRQFGEFNLVSAARIEDADLIVYDREQPLPTQVGSCPFDPRNSAGYTYFCPDGGDPLRAERLPLVSDPSRSVSLVIRVDLGRVTSQAGLNALAAHELGHALGIGGHSDQPLDLMFGLPTVVTPSARDGATLRFLLGQPPDLWLSRPDFPG